MVHARPISRHFALISAAALIVAAALASVGCGKKNESQVDDGIALTPTPSMQSCAAGQTYQGADWSRVPHSRAGLVPYGYGMQNYQPNPQAFGNQGFCGCQAGTQPMCDGSYGLVCMPTQMLTGQPNIMWYHYAPNGLQFSGAGGYTAYGSVYDPSPRLPPVYGSGYGPAYGQHPDYRPPYRHGRAPRPMPAQPVYAQPSSCATQVGQTCTVGTASCGSGYCQQVAPGQALGICTQ